MTKMMQAVEITAPGGPDVLQLTERPVPEPSPNEVVIRVAWAGVNRPDALQRAGSYAPPPSASDLPGLEASGEIVAIGTDLTLSGNAGIADPLFWSSMVVSLTCGLVAAWPVNLLLIRYGVKEGMMDPRNTEHAHG